MSRALQQILLAFLGFNQRKLRLASILTKATSFQTVRITGNQGKRSTHDVGERRCSTPTELQNGFGKCPGWKNSASIPSGFKNQTPKTSKQLVQALPDGKILIVLVQNFQKQLNDWEA